MCYGCEVREEARKKYVWKKLKEAREEIKQLKKSRGYIQGKREERV